jgi:hypothetical protein
VDRTKSDWTWNKREGTGFRYVAFLKPTYFNRMMRLLHRAALTRLLPRERPS